jgi:hypothetical protein
MVSPVGSHPDVAGKTTATLLLDSPLDMATMTSGNGSAARWRKTYRPESLIVIFGGLHLAVAGSLATIVSKYVDNSTALRIK